MNRNKIIFLVIGIIFLVVMVLIGLDISRKTTFPGSKGNLHERILEDKDVSKERKEN